MTSAVRSLRNVILVAIGIVMPVVVHAQVFTFTESVTSLAASNNGTFACGYRENGAIRLWDVTTRETKAILKGHTTFVTCLAFHPIDPFLASGSTEDERTIRIWDCEKNKELHILKTGSHVTGISFSRKGDVLIASTIDGVRGWKTDGWQRIDLADRDSAMCMCFRPDSNEVTAGYSDGTVRTWNIVDRKLVASSQRHRGNVDTLCYSPDGRLLASSDFLKKELLVSDVSGKLIGKIDCAATAITFTGSELVAGDTEGFVRSWDAKSLKRRKTVKRHDGPVHVVLRYGSKIASAGDDGAVILGDLGPENE